jgi:hypothetical protein
VYGRKLVFAATEGTESEDLRTLGGEDNPFASTHSDQRADLVNSSVL